MNKGLLAVIILNAVEWITTGAVAALAITTTGDAWWSMIMLIPAFCGYTYKCDEDKKRTENQ